MELNQLQTFIFGGKKKDCLLKSSKLQFYTVKHKVFQCNKKWQAIYVLLVFQFLALNELIYMLIS